MTESRPLSIALLARVAFWPVLAIAAYMAFAPQPPDVGIARFGDKFQHVLAFAILSVIAQLGFTATPRWRIAERLSFLGALIEVVQAIPALKRDCDIKDWIADTLAIVVVTAAFVWADRARARRGGA